MYFVYVNKEGYRFGDDLRDMRKYRDDYREYCYMSNFAEIAWDEADRLTEETGEKHYVRQLRSFPSRLFDSLKMGKPFRPYAHNGNGEQYL